jgi:hypothetical protein
MHPPRSRTFILAAVLSALLIATAGEPVVAAEAADTWAAGLKNLTPAQGKTLMKFARGLRQFKKSVGQCLEAN